MYKACGRVALTAGSRAVAWLPRSLFRCVGWRVKDPGWWAFRLLWLRLCGTSSWLSRVGRGWPTPVHGPGLLAQHDVTDFGMKFFIRGFSETSWSLGVARFLLPKGVWTVSTLMSALYGGWVRRWCTRALLSCMWQRISLLLQTLSPRPQQLAVEEHTPTDRSRGRRGDGSQWMYEDRTAAHRSVPQYR